MLLIAPFKSLSYCVEGLFEWLPDISCK